MKYYDLTEEQRRELKYQPKGVGGWYDPSLPSRTDFDLAYAAWGNRQGTERGIRQYRQARDRYDTEHGAGAFDALECIPQLALCDAETVDMGDWMRDNPMPQRW